MNDYNFGNFIYQLRTEKGLSQSQLGDMMGVSNKAVSKWEMGVSKPRPDMLIMLASFFGVTVEELLAGKRNEQAESQKNNERDDTDLKLWAGEYRKKKKCGICAVIMAITLPVLLFIFVGMIVGLNLADTVIGPIITMMIFFAEAIDIALIFVFYGSARRLKRILYATYPERAEEITAIIKQKRERIHMLKWEKICVITCSSITLACNFFRLLAYYYVEAKTRFIIDIVFLSFALLTLIIDSAILLHSFFRNRKK